MRSRTNRLGGGSHFVAKESLLHGQRLAHPGFRFRQLAWTAMARGKHAPRADLAAGPALGTNGNHR
jgi:hypothetical protein